MNSALKRIRLDPAIGLVLLAVATASIPACRQAEPDPQSAVSTEAPNEAVKIENRLAEALAAEAAANQAAEAALAEREALLESREELLRREEELRAQQARVAAQKAEAARRAEELAVRSKKLDNHEADLAFQEKELRDREAALEEVEEVEPPTQPREAEADTPADTPDDEFESETGFVADEPDRSLFEPGASDSAPIRVEASLMPGRLLEIEILETLTSRTSRAGDEFSARLVQDLKAEDGTLVVPAGAEVIGRVIRVEPLKSVGGQAALEVEFTHLVLSPTESIAISASLVELGANKRKDKKKIAGAAIVGAILGRVLGGDTEAVIGGAAAGAAAGTAAVARAKGKDAEIPAGEIVALQLEEVVTVTVEMKGPARN